MGKDSDKLTDEEVNMLREVIMGFDLIEMTKNFTWHTGDTISWGIARGHREGDDKPTWKATLMNKKNDVISYSRYEFPTQESAVIYCMALAEFMKEMIEEKGGSVARFSPN